MKLTAAVGICVTAALLAGCGSGDGDSKSDGGGGSEYVDGATFTMALKGDPGKLDPQSSASSQLFTVNQLGYDNLVAVDAKSGEIQSQLATEWKVDGTTVTLTLAEGVTCSDGSDFTATTVADNIAYVSDPKNKSPYLGVFLPAGATAKADDAAGTVTITLAQPAPFVLNGLASLPMVCESGMQDRACPGRPDLRHRALRAHGGGPRRPLHLRDPGRLHLGPRRCDDGREGHARDGRHEDHRERGHRREPAGRRRHQRHHGHRARRQAPRGAGPVRGRDRLHSRASSGTTTTPATRPATPSVRMALTQALDLGELASVSTAGAGTPATTLAAIEPVSCPGDSVSGSLPAQDADAAKAVLAGKEFTFLYSSAAGSGVAAAAELAVQQWEAAGAKVTSKGVDETALQGAIFGTGDWDIAWVPLNVNSPDQLVPFLSGPGLADGGTNFSGIDNKDYTDAVAEASAMAGTEGCEAWLKAESALVAAADIVPFANNVVKTFGNGAEFETPGQLVPTSIRMLVQ